MFYNSKGSNDISFVAFIISVKTCTICLVGLWSIVPVHPFTSVHIILVSNFYFFFLPCFSSQRRIYLLHSCLVLILNLANTGFSQSTCLPTVFLCLNFIFSLGISACVCHVLLPGPAPCLYCYPLPVSMLSPATSHRCTSSLALCNTV